jgi:hypothetical protein
VAAGILNKQGDFTKPYQNLNAAITTKWVYVSLQAQPYYWVSRMWRKCKRQLIIETKQNQ